MTNTTDSATWLAACQLDELELHAGVGVKLAGRQLALFKVDENSMEKIYAIDNWDPVGRANVMSRGIVGSAGEELYVASPLFKQRFLLANGRCLDSDDVALGVYETRVRDQYVEVALSQ